jgi:hypothetical protein
MNGAYQLLQRVLVQRFFFMNGGFFLVLFLLLFGVIDPGTSIRLQIDLMAMMATKPALLAGAMALLGLYFIKCLRFAMSQTTQPEFAVLYELQALSPRILRRYLALAFGGMYSPALAYSLCVVAVNVHNGAWWVAGVTVILQTALLVLGVESLMRRFLNRLQPSSFDRLEQKLGRLRPDYLRFGQYFSAYLLTRKKVLLLLLKAGSLLLLQLMVYINRDEPERAGTFYVLLFLIVAHGLVPWHLRRFSEGLPWLRNLPIPLSRRYAAFAGTYALLFLPEVIFLLLHVRSSLSYVEMLSFYALSVTMLCGLHAVLYLPRITMDRYLMLLLVLYPLSIIGLAIVSPWAMAGFWVLVSAGIFRLRFHAFEMAEEGA